MAALAPAQTPLMVQLPDGTLVPASGLVSTGGAPQIAGAEINDSGAIAPAATGQGAIPAAASPSNVIQLASRSHGGAANGALIGKGADNRVISPSDGGGGPDIGALISGLAKAAGATMNTQTQSDTPNAPPASAVIDGQNTPLMSLPDVPIAAANGATADDSSASSGGILDRLKSLLHGDSAAPATPAPAPLQASNMTAAAQPMGTAGPTGAGTPLGPAPQGALAAATAAPTPAPVTGPAPTVPTDTTGGAIPAAAPAAEPDYFTRLQNNPVALALLTGGLGMMSAASRPGATVGGSFGEGALSGVNAVYGQRAAAAQRQIDQQKADSEAALQAAQTGQANAETGAIPIKAGAEATDAQARLTAAQGDRYTWQAGNGDDGTGKSVPGMYRLSTKGDGEQQFYPGKVLTGKPGTGAKGGAPSVFQQKVALWQSQPGHEHDVQGALDYAAGHKKLSGADLMKSAQAAADRELATQTVQPDDPKKWADDRAQEIFTRYKAADAAASPEPVTQPAGGGTGAIPSNASPAPKPKPAGGTGALLPGMPAPAQRVVGKTTWTAPDKTVWTWTAKGWVH